METTTQKELIVSQMAEKLVGSEIIKLAGEVKQLIANGEDIKNLTIGDFNPKIFPIPTELKSNIIQAYREDHTNYPAANGIPELRESVSQYLKHYGKLDYSADQILIAGGARPLIYALYQTLVDPEDTVVFPVPSWNNNHYTHLSHGKAVFVETQADNKFMPEASDLAPYIKDATLIAVCSPLNPTGTTFTKQQLSDLCDLIVAENSRRGEREKPVYLLYDQIYWMLTHGDTVHYDPVSLNPEMKNYTVYIDGISKAFASTGVRVGWAFGPDKIINKMRAILGHVGAWSPKAEQVASSRFITNFGAVDQYMTDIKGKISDRLNGFHAGFQALKAKGLPVNSIAPEAAMYLTIQIDLVGKTKTDGSTITNTQEATAYVLNEAQLAIVPFYAFGASKDSSWFRLSVGTAKMEDIEIIIDRLEKALIKLS